jgi:hypothetical protein
LGPVTGCKLLNLKREVAVPTACTPNELAEWGKRSIFKCLHANGSGSAGPCWEP